jgi:hypothetical protein
MRYRSAADTILLPDIGGRSVDTFAFFLPSMRLLDAGVLHEDGSVIRVFHGTAECQDVEIRKWTNEGRKEGARADESSRVESS